MAFLLLLLLQAPSQPTVPENSLNTMRFRGELLRRDSDGFSPIDDFELVRFIDSAGSNRGYVLVQAGADRDSWVNAVDTTLSPKVRHVHDGVPYRLELIALTVDRELKEGAIWTNGRKTFRVGGTAKVDNTLCQELFISEGPARNHKLLVDLQTRNVLSLTQRVFMGRGDEFRLTLKIGAKPTRDEAAQDTKMFNQLLKVREAAGVDPAAPNATLSSQQLETIASALPGLRGVATSRWAKQLLSRITKDTTGQQTRTQKLADLKKAAIGQQLPAFQTKTVAGKVIDSKNLAGQVTVFHIWRYRDEPLTEPYGQTAYLDFMSGKYAGKPVRVIGINVDSRYTDKSQAGKANRSARKLIEFMNLGYPILCDDGSLVKKFGDPRSAAADLPLWVVADKSGKIRMWKTGYYKVDPAQGLKDLQEAIAKLLK